MSIRFFIATLFSFTTIFNIGVDAQPTANAFQLFGSVNIKEGKIILLPFADSSFYPGNMKVMVQRVQHGHFHFSGKIEYPYAFYIQVINDSDKLVYVSNMFFVDSGIQKIICKVGNMGRNPDIENVTTGERIGEYNEANRRIKSEIADLYKRESNLYDQYHKNVPTTTLASFSREFNTLSRRKDTILWNYAKQYPNSYVALWELVARSHSGYRAIYDSIYAGFSTDLKHTVTGKKLYKQLQSSSIVNTGNKFPKLILRDVNNLEKAISIRNDKKYTLIDF